MVEQALGLQTPAWPEHAGFRHKPSQTVFHGEHGRGTLLLLMKPKIFVLLQVFMSAWWLLSLGKGWHFGDS